MRTPLFDLDLTLDSGQVFRWVREGEWWSGVLGSDEVHLRQTPAGVEVRGGDETSLQRYFRFDDDLAEIYRSISKDRCMEELIDRFRGMRLIRQDLWECSASYLLASYSNIPRIKKMIENVCRTFGRPLPGGRYAFPTPAEIEAGCAEIGLCRLGYRADWLVSYAAQVNSGEFDLEHLRSLPYLEAVAYLKRIKGVGDKVADCIALFGLGHMEACPVDVRIARAMKEVYGVSGSYRKVSEYARRHFGPHAGYAQEYLYIAEDRTRKKERAALRSCTQDQSTHSQVPCSQCGSRRS
jgi:N-glycosylase/DNA lyase